MPRVAIAMPVYNGGYLLAESLECLRTQTCRDFEVRIFDNGSTDETNDVANSFAERDSRFRVFRSETTIPMGPNFIRAAEETDCDYFAWRADDDLSAPNFIECLVETLNANPQADLATCTIRAEKVHKNKANIHPPFHVPRNRLLGTLKLMFWNHPSWIFCMFRRDKLEGRYQAAINALPHPWAWDHLALFPYFLERRVVQTDQTYFLQRAGADPRRQFYTPLDTGLQWEHYKCFFKACAGMIDDSEFGPAERAVLKASLVRYSSKRTFRLRKIAFARMMGR